MHMKNIFKLLIVGGAVAFSLSSCEDMLETTPKQSITPELALADIEGYEALLYSAYRRNHFFNYYGQQMNVDPEIMADNLVLANRTGRFEGEFTNAANSHIGIWATYDLINEVNFLIAGVDEKEAEQALKDQLKGEGLFLRALTYHNLLRVYSYEPGQEVDGFNLGVIMRTEPTATLEDAEFKARSTNVQGYEQIEADLLAAIALLPEQTADNGPYRANKSAAKALLSRVYLYWGKWAEAERYANEAINNTAYATLVDSANYVTSFATEPHPESLFEIDVRMVDWNTVDGVNNSMHSMTTDDLGGQFVVSGSPELMESYDESDVRLQTWDTVQVGGQDHYQSKKWPGEEGNFIENIPIIRYSEVLLISAEAKARGGNAPGAVVDVNKLRSNRGLDDIADNTSAEALIEIILEERRKELALEGHRWFDLKRMGRDIPKPDLSGLDKLPYSSFKILAPIPFDQARLNDLLVQNPVY